MFQKIVVLGAGNFGTCLAQHLGTKGLKVELWARCPATAKAINLKHRNPRYLSHISLSPNIRAVTKLTSLDLEGSSALVLAIPTQFLRGVLSQVVGRIRNQVVVSAVKGIEISTLKFPMEIIEDVLGGGIGKRSVVLSGPSFASEVVVGQPTAVSLGSFDNEMCLKAQTIFHAPSFRAYTSGQPIGLEVAGALKNVIAIASGASKGLGFQLNAQAALLTRGMSEIVRVGVALGADPVIFNGLGGIGDLFLTCTSEKSRNFTVGFRLGNGERLPEILDSMGSVAEGVSTATAAIELGRRLKVSTPIIEQVYSVLNEGKDIKQAVNDLLNRDAKAEIDLPRQDDAKS